VRLAQQMELDAWHASNPPSDFCSWRRNIHGEWAANHQFCQHHRGILICIFSKYHGDLNMFALWQLLFDVSPANKRLETEWNKRDPCWSFPSRFCAAALVLCAPTDGARKAISIYKTINKQLCTDNTKRNWGYLGKRCYGYLKIRDIDKTIKTSEKSQSKISIFRCLRCWSHLKRCWKVCNKIFQVWGT